MALATNTKYQLADRLQADLQFAGYTVTRALATGSNEVAAGDPLLTVVNSGSTKVALISIDQRTYNGFNVVAELSSSAAVGLPEHVCYLAINSAASQLDTAQLALITKRLGTSSVQLSFQAVGNLDEAHLLAANVSAEVANDPRNGASGQ
jgi:hypothetical protein